MQPVCDDLVTALENAVSKVRQSCHDCLLFFYVILMPCPLILCREITLG